MLNRHLPCRTGGGPRTFYCTAYRSSTPRLWPRLARNSATNFRVAGIGEILSTILRCSTRIRSGRRPTVPVTEDRIDRRRRSNASTEWESPWIALRRRRSARKEKRRAGTTRSRIEVPNWHARGLRHDEDEKPYRFSKAFRKPVAERRGARSQHAAHTKLTNS